MLNTSRAAFWSSPSSQEESRYRITHHKRTKQRGNGQQQQQQQRPKSQDSWTWEEILNGEGPWAQAGEYRRPKAELEGAKAERRRYEEAARQRDSSYRFPASLSSSSWFLTFACPDPVPAHLTSLPDPEPACHPVPLFHLWITELCPSLTLSPPAVLYLCLTLDLRPLPP
ncbi:uncharacterized protein ACWYII_042099 [Salvelinus alpinus]